MRRLDRMIRLGLAVLAAAMLAAGARAATVTFSGDLDDAGNAALVGSGLAPSPPLFGDDFDIANNVAVYALSVPAAGLVRFDSNGFAAGGVDPYFTLFSGSGSGATFFASNYDQAFSSGGDFDLTLALSAGDYMVTFGAFANMSFAENSGVGTLADGFIGLGSPSSLGSTYYELVVTTQAQAVSEPATALLVVMGLLGLASRSGRIGAAARRPGRRTDEGDR